MEQTVLLNPNSQFDEMSAPSASTACPMSILDLPNETLQKIFAYFAQIDLVAIADVCSRFRTNAQIHSYKFKTVNSHAIHSVDGCRLFLNTLRNFGTFIETISL